MGIFNAHEPRFFERESHRIPQLPEQTTRVKIEDTLMTPSCKLALVAVALLACGQACTSSQGEEKQPGETPGPVPGEVANARGQRRALRPVHTYSIVARDPESGQLGVAVQSHWFSVGTVVPWAEAGVGAVATQSFAEPSYGKLGLDSMRAGKSAPDALKGLLAGDDERDVRQVAMIDAKGLVMAHTGAKNIQAAGHKVGKNFSVQANLMLNDTVWPAMAEAFESAKGDLAERMMAALEAGQSAGGDIRGQQSAALIVVTGKPTGRAWSDRIFDLRVDDSSEPVKELRRLLVVQRAYNHMNEGDEAVTRKDNKKALAEYSAAAKLAPDNLEIVYWHAVALVNMKMVDEALPLFARVFAKDKNWLTLTPRLGKAGLLPDDAKVMERILKVGAD